MHIHQRVWNYFRCLETTATVMKASQAVLLGMLFVGTIVSFGVKDAHASTNCFNGNHITNSAMGVTLKGAGSRNIQRISSTQKSTLTLTNAGYFTCHAAQERGYTSRGVSRRRSGRVAYNVFPYGQCTWWADQRYFQLHGVFVPWRIMANAWQWKYRAYQFHWHVSAKPSVGAIMVLQPWTEGAYAFGHVAIVERVLRNHHVIVSTMNWGASPWRVSYVQFAPGPGVSFISQF